MGDFKTGYVANTNIPEVIGGQDGGTVTSLLCYLFDEHLIDAAVVTTVADVTSEPAAPPPVTTAVAADLLVDSQQFAISENTPSGTDLFEITGGVLGDGFINKQPEVGTLSWSITGGTGETAFSITTDRKLQVLDPDQLDYETTTSFTLNVHAVDASSGDYDYDDTTIDILVGNAAGVEFEFNGKMIKDLGEPGKVVRVRLPEDFESKVYETLRDIN